MNACDNDFGNFVGVVGPDEGLERGGESGSRFAGQNDFPGRLDFALPPVEALYRPALHASGQVCLQNIPSQSARLSCVGESGGNRDELGL